MKRIRVIVNLIASWQLLLGLGCLAALSTRISHITWSPPPELSDTIIHWTQGLWPMTWQWIDTYFVVFIIVSLIGSVGLYLRKTWACVISVMSSGLTIVILVVWYIDAFSLVSEFGSLGFFIDYLLPVIIALIFIVPSVLNVIFLTRPPVKEYFKKPQQALSS
jgi:hypothetical protein